MATKPRSQWSEAYRRRIERAEAAGKSRQAARGHVSREHVSRKAREVAKTGTTSSQKAQIDKFARMQANRAESDDPDEAVRLLRLWTAEHGYARFKELRANVNARHKQKRERAWVERTGPGGVVRVHISVGGNTGAMKDEYQDFDLPEMPGGDDFGWLFYH